ncbi:hypothetical protein SAMN04487944_11491 [Gracilibacillus ureilyticus]|uniref:Uncharacterized protein n=2 Tax=Gracilibacillus ureilyticus TaxID=531814 RepID=A0A1H9TPT2_9BACI|nr:hypothetical protein SAMN04487944_11491 [Gracilibacillus ureilyticus]
MGSQEMRCKACEGSGMLMDDEQWHYTCSICNGDGFVSKVEEDDHPIIDTDVNHRILE